MQVPAPPPVVYEQARVAQSSDLNTTAYKSAIPLYRIRPMMKSEEDLEAERQMYFEVPRKTCEQIAPSIERLRVNPKTSEVQHRWHILKRILKRARYKKLDETIIPHLVDLDRSEKVVPHGEISKRIYNEIFHTRDFDLYGNIVPPTVQPPRKHLEMRFLATKLGIEYTQGMQAEVVDEKQILNEEEELLQRRKAAPKLTTSKWDIGHEMIYNAPVGLAKNPSEPFNSLGNEQYYSYDGNWKHGKMHGFGKYLFEDSCTYQGQFEDNRPNGKGTSTYPHGQVYRGEWKNGQYYGKGKYSTKDGVQYEGEFVFGKRHGVGKLEFPSGLSYEGEFFDGKPHGRGIMRSKLTGWAYDGNFVKGFIKGMGQIISPPPKSEHTIYYWDESRPDITLPGIVRHLIEEQERERNEQELRRNAFQAPLRGAQLKEYVTNIRTQLHSERAREKRERYNATVLKAKEEKARLYEARIKALAGDEEPPSR